MSEKVKLTKEQAKAIENIREQKTLPDAVIIHSYDPTEWQGTFSNASTIRLDHFIRALYIGYEVELTVEEQLLERHNDPNQFIESYWSKQDAFSNGIYTALDIIGMKVKGINE